MTDILGIGAPIVDHILYVSEDHISSLGQKGGMELLDFKTFSEHLSHCTTKSHLIPGGSSANTIRGLANLGNKCAFIGKIGNDLAGALFIKEVKSLDITCYISKGMASTSQVLSFVTPDGERTCRAFLGASLEMKPEDIDPLHFNKVKIVHIEGYTLGIPGLTIRCMEYAKGAGALVSFDLGNFEIVRAHHNELHRLLHDYVDICFANAEEVFALTNLPIEQGSRFLNKLCKTAVVHNGIFGCWVAHNGNLAHYPSYAVENPIDTTAAGDLFASGFLHGVIENRSLSKCADYGALIGAAVVQVQGSTLTQNQWQHLRQQIN